MLDGGAQDGAKREQEAPMTIRRHLRPGRPRPLGTDRPPPENLTLRTLARLVRVRCPECGIVRVRADRVVVRRCVDDQSWSYRARCPVCDSLFVGATPATLAVAAVMAGVAVEVWTRPAPSERRSGPPLRAIDALELHLALLEPDWFAQVTRLVTRPVPRAEPSPDR
jgi:hypothetical protein